MRVGLWQRWQLTLVREQPPLLLALAQEVLAVQLWVPQKAYLAVEVQSRLPGGAGIWGERALVVLIPAFTDVTGEPKAVLVEVTEGPLCS